MMDNDCPAGGSAFCDQIIEKFIGKLQGIEGLKDAGSRLREELITRNRTSEAALRQAIFDDSSND